jgi:hypothetical protein
MPRYIRRRENDKWQLRLRSGIAKVTFTHPDLDVVIARRNQELGYDPDKEDRAEPKILVFDIETAPIEAYVWGLYDQNIGLNQIKADWYILCFAYKWLGGESKFLGLCDYEGYKSSNDNERNLVEDLYCLLNEANVVVAHNAVRFDVKKVNSRILYYGLPKPHPYKVVDTLKIARSNFALTSNKLDYITKFLGGEGKLENEGMGLWIGCMGGDKDAWEQMKAYNLRDIDELESIYLALRGWDKSHPNLAHYYDDDLTRCTSCGSEKIEPLGEFVPTNTQTYPGYRCLECGQIMRGRKNITPNKEKLLVNAR